MNTDTLIRFAMNQLSATEAAAVAAELARNPQARDTVERLRLVARTLREDDSTPAPASTLAAAKRLFRERPVAPPVGWLEQLQRLVAALVFDSRPQAALAGVRGATGTFQLSFESEAADVDVQLEQIDQETGSWQILGQVTPHLSGTVQAVVLATRGTFEIVNAATPDANGAFCLKAGRGSFDILISVADALVVLPGVELR